MHDAVWTMREAPSADAETIDTMTGELAASTGLPHAKTSHHHDLEAALSAPNRFLHAIVAALDGSDVGVCLWFPYYSSWRGRCGIFVQDLYAAPQVRRRGLGPHLLRAAAREGARHYGASFIRLAADHSNAGAARFYARIGFQPMDGDRHFDLDGAGFDAFCGEGT